MESSLLGLLIKMGSSSVIAKIVSYYYYFLNTAVDPRNLKCYGTDETESFCIDGCYLEEGPY